MSNTIGTNLSLPAEALTDSRIEQLVEMGFELNLATRALRRSNNDWDAALTMLTAGLVPEEDEFDLMPDHDTQAAAPTRPAAAPKAATADHFREGVPKDAPDSAIVDSRVSTLMEMGFDGGDAEKALKVAKNDFDLAVQLLANPVDDLSA